MADKFLNSTGLEYLWGKIKTLMENKSNKGHTHTADSLSGNVPVSKGGTGASTAAAARTNLGAVALPVDTDGNVLYGTDGQSAVSDGLGGVKWVTSTITELENTDSSNKIPLRSLASGTYILKGYFTAFTGSSASFTFSSGTLVFVVYSSSMSYVQIPYAKNNVIQYLQITDTEYTRNDAKLGNMETTSNKVSDLSADVTDDQYPSAKAVYDAILAQIADSGHLSTSGGTMEGVLVAQSNTDYTTKQVRNIFLVAEGEELPAGANGDVCLVYTP